MLKSILIFLVTFVLLLSCSRQKKPSLIPGQEVGNVTVLVFDLSASTDQQAQLTAAHLRALYHSMAFNGGGKFYGLLILSNSSRQEAQIYEVLPQDTMPIKGNLYQRQHRLRLNREKTALVEQGCDAFVSAISAHMLLSKTEKFSDLRPALELAQQILSNSVYKNAGKQLLIISDMLNDRPPKNGVDKMRPVSLSPEIKVAVVRPSSKVKIEELLPGNPVQTTATIDDAITYLFSSTTKN